MKPGAPGLLFREISSETPYLRELLVLALGDDGLLPQHPGAQVGGRRRHGGRVLQGVVVAEGPPGHPEGQRHLPGHGPAAPLQRCQHTHRGSAPPPTRISRERGDGESLTGSGRWPGAHGGGGGGGGVVTGPGAAGAAAAWRGRKRRPPEAPGKWRRLPPGAVL